MGKRKPDKPRSSYRVIIDSDYALKPLPPECLRATTLEDLEKCGFERIQATVVRRYFSHVLELRIGVRGGRRWIHDWRLSTDEFGGMVRELRGIKRYIDDQAERLLRLLMRSMTIP